jgi:hypothetical protein
MNLEHAGVFFFFLRDLEEKGVVDAERFEEEKGVVLEPDEVGLPVFPVMSGLAGVFALEDMLVPYRCSPTQATTLYGL